MAWVFGVCFDELMRLRKRPVQSCCFGTDGGIMTLRRLSRALIVLATSMIVLLPMMLGANAGEGHGVDSLHAVVLEALRSNPELGAVRFNRGAVDEELRAARATGLPSVDLRSGIGRERSRTKNGLGLTSDDPWRTGRDVSLVMSQRIFDGFERGNEVLRQKNRVDSARWRVADTANSIALRTVQSYLELQRAQSVLEAAQGNLSALQKLDSHVRDRVSAGHGDQGDRTESASRVENAKALVFEARERVGIAIALFREVVGRTPARLAAARLPTHALPSSISLAVEEARQAAPSIVATEHDTKAADAAVGSAYSHLYPKLNFEMSTYHGKSIDEKNDYQNDLRGMFVVRWSLFDGGANYARIREAKARANEAAEVAENTKRIVERETRVSWNAMMRARDRAPALRRQLNLARATRETYYDQFTSGTRRLLDLLDAQSEVFTADAAYRTEKFYGSFNTFRVLAAMGQLVAALGLEMPSEAIREHQPSVLDGWVSVVRATR